jgi:competence protein ComFC
MGEHIPGIPLMKSEFWKKGWDFLFAGGTRCRLCENVHSDLWNGICPSCFDTIPWLSPPICRVCGRSMSGIKNDGDAVTMDIVKIEDDSEAPLIDGMDAPTDTLRCMDCVRRDDTPFICNRSAVHYEEPVKSWLQHYKFKGLQRMAVPLAEMILQAYWLHYADLRMDAVTYIPLHPDRELERGFNQARQLAKIISRQTHIPMVELLVRNRDTDKQSKRDRSERLTLLQGAFEFNRDLSREVEARRDSRREKWQRILIIDDVYTTGATLSEASIVIRRHLDVEVYTLTMAR